MRRRTSGRPSSGAWDSSSSTSGATRTSGTSSNRSGPRPRLRGFARGRTDAPAEEAGTVRTLVVVPAKNLETRIGDVVQRVRANAPGVDVLVIDDGSDDDTAEAASEAGARVVRHEINRGKGEAIKTGIAAADEGGYDAMLTMDGDGQHDPVAVPDFLKAMASGRWDIVVGSRMSNTGSMPPLRVWTNRTTSRIVSLLAGQTIPDSQSGYRIHRTVLLRDMPLVSSRYDLESEILIRAGRRGHSIGWIPIESIYEDSESHINPFVDTFRFIRLVVRSARWR
ncbi:MAG: glycosyltransferase [Candidatus Eisenbacteria bacterium]|nr:glycosyltransferase [Candidatus Eisenbacteria bacterium]